MCVLKPTDNGGGMEEYMLIPMIGLGLRSTSGWFSGLRPLGHSRVAFC